MRAKTIRASCGGRSSDYMTMQWWQRAERPRQRLQAVAFRVCVAGPMDGLLASQVTRRRSKAATAREVGRAQRACRGRGVHALLALSSTDRRLRSPLPLLLAPTSLALLPGLSRHPAPLALSAAAACRSSLTGPMLSRPRSASRQKPSSRPRSTRATPRPSSSAGSRSASSTWAPSSVILSLSLPLPSRTTADKGPERCVVDERMREEKLERRARPPLPLLSFPHSLPRTLLAPLFPFCPSADPGSSVPGGVVVVALSVIHFLGR